MGRDGDGVGLGMGRPIKYGSGKADSTARKSLGDMVKGPEEAREDYW